MEPDQRDMLPGRPRIPNPPPPTEPARENNPDKEDLRKAAAKWIEDNPTAYGYFVRFALELAERGRPFGIGLVAERVRWECVVARGDDGYKINNNYRAYVARKLVAEHPRLRAFLKFRKTRY